MKRITNQDGFTYILALTIIMIMGVMLGMVGQSWKTIKQRDREKELLFRGSQIKEAIENWNNPKYSVPGVTRHRPVPLTDLKFLLKDPTTMAPLHFLPPNYAAEVDDENPRCAPNCAKIKLLQDPMTGKEWTIIRGAVDAATGAATVNAGSQTGAIIGVASKSDDKPFRTDFKETALENLGTTTGVDTTMTAAGALPLKSVFDTATDGTAKTESGNKIAKYSQWKFIADPKNDHTKLYRAYHEGW